ncbi:MAG TPA: ankyrin repeat domain-containing protein [Myxococcota bacterium]|nr:ankyrin repeat domain-containing protein [Myxococcota bacterium]HRY93693.1 ankyrin repeat domain-containing protein [Myxococcota bacterium]
MALYVKTVLPNGRTLGERLVERFPLGFTLAELLALPGLSFEDREEFRWGHARGARELLLGDVACLRDQHDGARWRVEDRRGDARRWLLEVLGKAEIFPGWPVDLGNPKYVLGLFQAAAALPNPAQREDPQVHAPADVRLACEQVAGERAEERQVPSALTPEAVRSLVSAVTCALADLEWEREADKFPVSELPLVVAAYAGDLAEVHRLLEQGAAVDEFDSAGDRAASWAAVAGNAEMVKALHAAGADLTRRGPDGWSLLHSAMECPEMELVQYLLDQGVPADASSRDGTTVLHMAAYCGDEAVIDLLVSRGAEVNALAHGDTPLDFATSLGLRETARALRKHGGKFSIDL